MRKKNFLLSLTICAGLLGLATTVQAGEKSKSTKTTGRPPVPSPAATTGEKTVAVAAMPVFKVPNQGAPAMRMGGATRSTGGNLPRIEALVPEEAGWTLRKQPVVYWYLSKPTDVRIELVVLSLDPTETLVEKQLPKPANAGIQRIRFADHGIRLELDKSYQWLVKLVPNPSDRSYDRIVGGGIELVPTGDDLSRQLADPTVSRPHALAAAGIWYDAVDAYTEYIDQYPDNENLWNQRTALFKQVGLPEVRLRKGDAAGFERR